MTSIAYVVVWLVQLVENYLLVPPNKVDWNWGVDPISVSRGLVNCWSWRREQMFWFWDRGNLGKGGPAVWAQACEQMEHFGTSVQVYPAISEFVFICICFCVAIFTLGARGVNPSTFLSLNLPGPPMHIWNIYVRPPAFTFVCIFFNENSVFIALFWVDTNFNSFSFLRGFPYFCLFLQVYLSSLFPKFEQPT